jgi:tetratricopeptide (TPR) repeat protein
MSDQLHQRPTLGVRRVFLSSTSVDLEPYRDRVASLVQTGFGQFPVVMNTFPLRPSGSEHTPDATEVSLNELRSSQIYILLLAWRYGHVPQGQTLSVTHLEYREAVRLRLPCFVFLADPHTDTDQSSTALFPADVRDPEYREQLLAFRTEVSGRLVQTFASMDELVDKVVAALHLSLPATQPAPREVPPPVAGFVGRERELERLMDTLRSGQSVELSALVAGLGGVGKSALAAEAMRRLASEEPSPFPGGMTWVRCDGRTGMEGLAWVYAQLLTAWGEREEVRGARTALEEAEAREAQLRATLQAQPTALALLDNVEVEFLLARAVATLSALGMRLLVTARHRPSLPQLRLLSLDILEEDEAVALFAKRFTAQDGDWEAVRDAPVAKAVVARLGHLPLAIELAAARAAVAQMSAGELAAELAQPQVVDRLKDPLTGEAAVRYAFDRGLALLEPRQRLRFAALGLPDGAAWPRPVIEALFAWVRPPDIGGAIAPEGRDSTPSADLDRLVALSLVTLVRAGTSGPAGEMDGNQVTRVRVHPLLRELAEAEWATQAPAVRRAALEGLVRGALAWAEQHRVEDARAYAVLEEDEALLVGAHRRAVGAQVALPQSIQLAFALMDYLSLGGHSRVGVEVWTLAAKATRETHIRFSEGAALGNLAVNELNLGEWERARHHFEQALGISRELRDHQGEAVNLHNLGELASEQEDLNSARRFYEQALAIKRKRGSAGDQSMTLTALGDIANKSGRFQDARRYLTEALDLARTAHALRLEGYAVSNLGDLARLEQRYDDAQRFFEEALAIARQVGERNLEGQVYISRGQLARDQGQWEAARGEFALALTLFEAMGAKAHVRKVREQLAAPAAAEAQVIQVVAATERRRRRWPWTR